MRLNWKLPEKLEIIADADGHSLRFYQQTVVIASPLPQSVSFFCKSDSGNDYKIKVFRLHFS